MSTKKERLDTPEPVPMRKSLPKSKYYLVTAAQNATDIHQGFWKALKHAKRYYSAELAVLPGRYKNPTSRAEADNAADDYWAPEVVKYLVDAWIPLNNRLVLLGGVKIEWAAKEPLVGLDSLTKDKSGIVGHGSCALRSIATPQHKHPKIMFTTGACTVDNNYSNTKRGVVGEFNHCIGALIVEIQGDTFFVRQLNARDDGSFIDLDKEFTPNGVRTAGRALTLSMGDTHCRFILKDVIRATFDAPDSMVKLLNPQYLFWHDVTDFHSRNHHHRENDIVKFAKWKAGMESVKEEWTETIQFVRQKTPAGTKSVVVSSNHDRAGDRWLTESRRDDDPVNMLFYHEMKLAVLKTARRTSGGVYYEDPFILFGRKLAGPNVRFLKEGESFVIGHVEYGFHGHLGPNGARGTTKNLSRMGIKVTKGHSHTAEIVGGCYSAGKSTGMLEYERNAPSAHSNSHVVQYANGKRAILFIINGRYCLPRKQKKKK